MGWHNEDKRLECSGKEDGNEKGSNVRKGKDKELFDGKRALASESGRSRQ